MKMASKIRKSNSFGRIWFLVVAVAADVIDSFTLHSGSTKVALWCETPLSSTMQLALNDLVEKLNSRLNSSLRVEVIPLNISTVEFYNVLRSLEAYDRENEMIVVTSLNVKVTWLWSSLLCNKNTIILDIQNPGVTERAKEEFFVPNYLSLVPPENEKRLLLRDMLDRMLCKKNVTLACSSSQDNGEHLRKKLQLAKEEMIYCIVLDCRDNPYSVFTIAKHYGLLGSSYRWFSYYFEEPRNFSDLPQNLISILLSKSIDSRRNQMSLNLFGDALTLVGKVKKDHGKRYTIRNFREVKFMGATGFVHFSKDRDLRQGSNYDVFQLIQLSNTTGWLKIGMWRDNSFDTSLMAWILKEVSRLTRPLLRIATMRSKPWVFLTAVQDVEPNTSQCLVGLKCREYTSYVSETNNSFVEYCCSGVLVELLQELMKRVEFTPRLHFVKDNKFGSINTSTQQWNGMIGEVLRDEADTALYSLTITERRAEAVSFSYPILAAGSGILISVDNKKTYDTVNHSFLKPFTHNLWLGTIGVFAATVVILWIAERLNQRRVFQTLLGSRKKSAIYTFIEIMTYTWGVCMQKVIQEGGPRTFGGRVVVATFGFYMIVILCSYTANLAAIKVAEDEKMEISGIYDDKFLNPTSEFKFTSSKFTATSEFFKLSPDPRLNEIYRVMKDHLVLTRAEALRLLKSGEIQAFFEDTPSLHYMASQQEDCNLKVVGKSFGNSGYGMPFKPNSTWLRPISAALREMHEDDIIQALSAKWLESACVSKDTVNIAERLGIRDMSGMLLLLASFCVGSFLVLAFEFMFKQMFSTFFYTHTRSCSYNVPESRFM